jgi:hypothetical protein
MSIQIRDTLAPNAAAAPGRRLGVLLWLAGMLGAAVVTVTLLPQLGAQVPLPGPLWVLMLASFAQSAVVVGVATSMGVVLAPAVGLHAPAFEAAAAGRPIAPALRPQLLPGVVGGVPGGLLLVAIFRYAPDALIAVQARFNPPLLARVLYGGITEELLLRWGVMTALVWLAWRFLQRRTGTPQQRYVWLAIIVSAFLFGVGHLPVVKALVGTVDVGSATFVIGANAMFGLLFGYLFARWGLESAMIAHAMAHAVAFVANLL